MLLAIDAGNTNIVFAVFEGETLKGSWRASTDARRTADEYAVWFTQLLGLQAIAPADIDACIISCVVPDALFSLTSLAKRYFRAVPRIVGEQGLDLGIGVLLDRPEEVGADRLVNAVAAKLTTAPPLIVIDFGTATTFDVVDAEGQYAGGVIAPGINLSLRSALQRRGPAATGRDPADPQGHRQGTILAMQSGIFWGYIGLIEGLVRASRPSSASHEGRRDRRPGAAVRRRDRRHRALDSDLTLPACV